MNVITIAGTSMLKSGDDGDPTATPAPPSLAEKKAAAIVAGCWVIDQATSLVNMLRVVGLDRHARGTAARLLASMEDARPLIEAIAAEPSSDVDGRRLARKIKELLRKSRDEHRTRKSTAKAPHHSNPRGRRSAGRSRRA